MRSCSSAGWISGDAALFFLAVLTAVENVAKLGARLLVIAFIERSFRSANQRGVERRQPVADLRELRLLFLRVVFGIVRVKSGVKPGVVNRPLLAFVLNLLVTRQQLFDVFNARRFIFGIALDAGDLFDGARHAILILQQRLCRHAERGEQDQ